MKKAEKGYDITKYGGWSRAPKYPWRTMKVGESFLLDTKSGSASQCAHANRLYAPKRFAQRKTPEGVRVWRIK